MNAQTTNFWDVLTVILEAILGVMQRLITAIAKYRFTVAGKEYVDYVDHILMLKTSVGDKIKVMYVADAPQENLAVHKSTLTIAVWTIASVIALILLTCCIVLITWFRIDIFIPTGDGW